MTAEELKVIADLTARLTELRLKGCGHLCIENYAPQVFEKLLSAYQMRVEYKYNGLFLQECQDGDRLFAMIVHIDNEVGGIASRYRRKGWQVFSRVLRPNRCT